MRTRTATAGYVTGAIGSPSPQRIRWGAVFGGAIVGIAILVLLTTLWLTLAYASGTDVIRDNMEWFIGGSAIGCLFIAGLLAGWLSGVHGAGSGFFNGVTIWALMLLLTLSVGVPAILNVLNLGSVDELDTTGGLLNPSADTALWATFLSILGGLVASGLGGAIGGAFARPANANLMDKELARTDEETEEAMDRPGRPDVAQRTVVAHDAEDESTATHAHRVP
ncbi:MAG: hypothetical protein ACXWXK_06785 [Actinomycetota bacterium]